MDYVNSKLVFATRSYYVTEEDDDSFQNWNIVVDDSTKVSTENGNDILGDGSMSLEYDEPKLSIAKIGLLGPGVWVGNVCGALLHQEVGYATPESDDWRYTIQSCVWTGDGQPVSEGHIFEEGCEYIVTAVLRPHNDCEFRADCDVLLNNRSRMEARLLDNGCLEVTDSWDLSDGQSLSLQSAKQARGARRLLDGGYALPTWSLVLNLQEDYASTTGSTIIENSEPSGVVMYLDKDVTLTTDGDSSALVLNEDTVITGPGTLTVVCGDEGNRVSGPAAIQVNGCKLTIENTAVKVVGCNGIRGKTVDGRDAELEIDYSTVSADTKLGGVYGFNGGVTLTDCVLTSPSPDECDASSAGFYRKNTANHPPFEQLRIEAGRQVRSIGIDGVDPDSSYIMMDAGDSRQLSVTVLPADAADRHVTWSSGSDDVSVSADGTVTALRVGGGLVTATCGGMSASVHVNVNEKEIEVEDVLVVPGSVTVGVGSSAELWARLVPGNATNHIGKWYTADSSVAVLNVDEDWRTITEEPVRVTGVTAGEETEIYVLTWNGSANCCTVRVVEDFVPAEAVRIEGESSRVLKLGDELVLSAAVSPENASDKTVVWTSRDPGVVSVEQNGRIVAMNYGSTEIEAAVWNGTVGAWSKSYVTIQVQPSVTGVSLSAPASRIYVGDAIHLNAYPFPGNAADRGVTFHSDNEAVATVDEYGVVTGVGDGSTLIWATTVDGGFSESVGVTVEAPPARFPRSTASTEALRSAAAG